MPGGSIGTAFVDVAFDPKQIEGQLGGLGGKMTSGFGKMGSLAGAAMVTGVGAAIAGGVAVGKYLYDVGSQFDEMSDSIRTATGATGKELTALSDTAKKVGTDVPASFKDAGTAVAQVSTRLGLTGKPLRDVSDQMLELARLSGTDLPTALNSFTRMLGDAGLKGADASAGIDKLWRAAQASQVPVTRLADLMTKFGGPMRQLGFTFDEQAALLAKFEKEGVNTELVMGSMRIALGKMAKAGKDPVKALRDTIEAIKNTGDAGTANRKAIELFGARAGPDMAAAIREGRFSIDDLVKTISKGKDTVKKASDDTKDFSENWLIFKNKVAVAVAPAAEKMFAGIGKGMDELNKHMPDIQAAFGKELGPTVEALGPVFTDLGKIIQDLGPVWKVLADLAVNALNTIKKELEAFAQIIGGIAKVVRGLLEGDFGMVWEGVKQAWTGAFNFLKAVVEGWVGYFAAILGPLKGVATNIGNAILDGLRAGIEPIVGIATTAFNAVRSAITSAAGAIGAAATAVGTAIASGISTVLSTLGRLTTTAFGAVRTAISAATGAIVTAARAVGTAVASAITAVFNTLRTIATTAFNAIATAIRALIGAASTAARAYVQAITTVITTVFNTYKTIATTAFNAVVSAIRGVIGSAMSAAQAVGAAIVSGLKAGLAAVYGAVKGGLDAIWRAISAVAGAAAGAAVAIGTAIISGIVSGLSGLIGAVGSKIASSVSGAISWARGHTGSTTEEYSKAQLGDPIPAGIIAGVVEGEQPIADSIAKTVAGAVESGRKSIAAGRDKFGAAWDDVTSGVLEAFDRMKARLKTPAERLLADMEFDRQVAEAKAKIQAAQGELAAARAAQAALAPQEGETPEAFAARSEEVKQRVLAAEKGLQDAQYEQERTNLERRAELQRVQLDARIAAQRKNLEDALTAQGTAYAQGHTNAVTAHNNLLKTLNAYGVKYQAAGKTLGVAFVKGLNTDINAGMASLEALLERIRRAISAVTTANAGAHAGPAAAPAAVGLAAVGLAGAPAGPTALGAPAGGTLYGKRSPFAGVTQAIRSARVPALEVPAPIVRVYIGDQELRGIVRTEVGYIDDATARVVLAGAR